MIPIPAGQLIIKPKGASLTRDTELFGTMDPFMVIHIGNQKYTSGVSKDKGKHPVWFDVFKHRRTMEVDLRFEIWDSDSLSKNDYIADGSYSLVNVFARGKVVDNVIVQYKGKPCGTATLELEFYPDTMQQPYPQQPMMPQQPYPQMPMQPQQPYPQQPVMPQQAYPQQPMMPQQPYPQQPAYPQQPMANPYPQQPMMPQQPYPQQPYAQPGYPPAMNVQVQFGMPQQQGVWYKGRQLPKINYNASCHKCHGTGFKGQKPCAKCYEHNGYCKKCYGTGFNFKKAENCKHCGFHKH